MNGIFYKNEFISSSKNLYGTLEAKANWDSSMRARKTASYGVAYNYSQMHYPYQDFLPEIDQIRLQIRQELGFEPNNCLINFYLDGQSKMGFHSDQTDILEPGTGVAIVSLGETRTLRFRKINDHNQIIDYQLVSGSLLYMTQEIQDHWQHAIIRSGTEKGRMSLTFRAIRP